MPIEMFKLSRGWWYAANHDVAFTKVYSSQKDGVLMITIAFRFNEQMTAEQARSKAALEAKLVARRNRKNTTGKARLEKDALLEEEEETRRKMMDRMKQEAEDKQKQAAADSNKQVKKLLRNNGN